MSTHFFLVSEKKQCIIAFTMSKESDAQVRREESSAERQYQKERKTEMTEEKDKNELEQTSYEKKHDIEAGTVGRSDILKETPEETKERIDRDIKAGLRGPLPETVDQTKFTVSAEQSKKMADAAPRAYGEREEDQKKGEKSHEKESHHKKN